MTYGQPNVCVMLPPECRPLDVTLVAEESVEIVNCEEDGQRADVVTFICPTCGREHKSKRYG